MRAVSKSSRTTAGTVSSLTYACFQGVGYVAVKTVLVKHEGELWYLILISGQVRSDPLPTTGDVVGIDIGIASFSPPFRGLNRHVSLSMLPHTYPAANR